MTTETDLRIPAPRPTGDVPTDFRALRQLCAAAPASAVIEFPFGVTYELHAGW